MVKNGPTNNYWEKKSIELDVALTFFPFFLITVDAVEVTVIAMSFKHTKS